MDCKANRRNRVPKQPKECLLTEGFTVYAAMLLILPAILAREEKSIHTDTMFHCIP